MISPKIEASRISYVKRNMELHGFKIYQPEELIREAVEKHRWS